MLERVRAGENGGQQHMEEADYRLGIPQHWEVEGECGFKASLDCTARPFSKPYKQVDQRSLPLKRSFHMLFLDTRYLLISTPASMRK